MNHTPTISPAETRGSTASGNENESPVTGPVRMTLLDHPVCQKELGFASIHSTNSSRSLGKAL